MQPVGSIAIEVEAGIEDQRSRTTRNASDIAQKAFYKQFPEVAAAAAREKAAQQRAKRRQRKKNGALVSENWKERSVIWRTREITCVVYLWEANERSCRLRLMNFRTKWIL